LLIGCIEILLFAFVFPRKATFLPNIRKTALALGFRLFSYAVGLFEREEFGIFDDTFLEAE
jgi:hypothetical protein